MILINDKYTVFSGEVRLPRVGVGSGDLVVNSEVDISGPVKIATDDGSFELVGTAFRHGEYVQHLKIHWIAGADGMNTSLAPKGYNGYTLGRILADTLSAVGERMSDAIDARLLAIYKKHWQRLAQTAKAQVIEIMRSAGVDSWRILPDGSLWMGTETWPAVPTSDQWVQMNWNRAENWALIGSENPFLLPGVSLPMDDEMGHITSQRVSYVVHSWEADKIRQTALFEDEAIP